MPNSNFKIPLIALLIASLVTLPVAATSSSTSTSTSASPMTRDDLAAFSMSMKDFGNVREYYSSNKDNRFLIRVHIWGDTPLSGIHYIPDNSTLLDAVSYSGGPTGDLSGSTLTLHRLVRSKSGVVPTELKIDGKNLASKAEYVNYPLQNGDVIYLEAPKKSDALEKNIALVASILGILTASLTIYLVFKK